jgi:hypothetical protein
LDLMQVRASLRSCIIYHMHRQCQVACMCLAHGMRHNQNSVPPQLGAPGWSMWSTSTQGASPYSWPEQQCSPQHEPCFIVHCTSHDVPLCCMSTCVLPDVHYQPWFRLSQCTSHVSLYFA